MNRLDPSGPSRCFSWGRAEVREAPPTAARLAAPLRAAACWVAAAARVQLAGRPEEPRSKLAAAGLAPKRDKPEQNESMN